MRMWFLETDTVGQLEKMEPAGKFCFKIEVDLFKVIVCDINRGGTSELMAIFRDPSDSN